MKRKLFFISLLALASVACEKEPDAGDSTAKELTITATTDGAILPEWKSQDEILVTCNDEVYTFVTDKGGKTADFTDAEGLLTSELVGDSPVAAYLNCTNMFGAFKIQAEQTWKNGASSALIPAYAYTMNAPVENRLAMAFKPLASVLALTVAPYDIIVEKITIAPVKGATVSEGAMAGTFSADASQGNVKVTNELNEIVLTPAEPVDMKQGATFSIPLGWFKIEGGLEITMTYGGNQEYPFVIWTEGIAKTYDDASGLKSSRLITETLEFDSNSFPRAWYVKAGADASAKGLSWETATSLDYALKTALPGSVLHLAAGTYRPATLLECMTGEGESATPAPAKEEFKSFLIDKNISIIGGYPANASTGAVADASNNKTILDGDGKSYHTIVVSASKVVGEKVVIEGITITGGNSTEDAEGFYPCNGTNLSSSNAGGIALLNSIVEMKNVTVKGNKAANNAGLYCADCEIVMTDCSIDGNEAITNVGGALFTSGTRLVMDGCSISNNIAGGIVGGAYLYIPEKQTLEAEIKKSNFDNNVAVSNAGGLYVRDDSGSNNMKLSFTDCTFNGNQGLMGGCILVNNAILSFKTCEFKGNRNSGNGNIYMYTTDAKGAIDVTFDGCSYIDNYPAEGAASGLIGGIYLYTNYNSHPINAYITNCLFADNRANGRGASIYMRNAKVDQINLYVANCTFADNQSGHTGSAINLYGTAAFKVEATVVSCTAVGNTSTNTAANKIGAFCCETAGTTMNIYNSIASGNLTNEGNACDVNNVAGVMAIKSSFIGSDYYGAEGTLETVSPAFDYKTMLGAFDGAVVKLTGTAATNPAFSYGMTAAELKKLSSGNMTSDILAKDQKGNARTDSDKIAGSYVK